jgi:hypothetical protein
MKPKPKPKLKLKIKPTYDSVVEEEMEMPPVPVPDYTLQFGNTARPISSKRSDEGTSFTGYLASHRGTSASGVDRRNSCKLSP